MPVLKSKISHTMNSKPSDKIAKIDNSFILNAQYRMTAKEQKILYYLISHLDPKNEKEFHTITVPIGEIEDTLRENNTNKNGSFYEDIDRICKNFIRKEITFPSKFLLGNKRLNGYISIFQSIMPIEDENGQLCIEFSFSNKMSPFLLQLHHYVNIGVLEVVQMKNAHAIRMYSVFKSERDRMKEFTNVVTLSYELDELKAMLGIDNKYSSDYFKNFKVNVLDRIRDEINEKCPTMFVKYEYLKTRRKVTGVVFSVYERKTTAGLLAEAQPVKEKKAKTDIKSYTPSHSEIETLTRAKLKAYTILVEFGIFEGIAFKQILTKIKGSEFDGYEDFFIEKAIQHFEKNAIQNTTKELKASTFVTWWTKNKIFSSGDVWADILEKLVKHKKQLQANNPSAFENRIIAKTMTNNQFKEYIKKQQNG